MRTAAIFLFLGLLGAAAPADAQTAAATLLVEARDAAGAPVPGVLATIASSDTGLDRAGVTVDDGTVWLVRLPAGVYTLTAVKGGFKTEVIKGITIETAARGKITLVLKPGAYTEQVVVEAAAATLKIGTGAVGAVFDSNEMLALPVAEREALEFASQAPGMAPPAPGSRLSTQGNTGVNSAGAREAANNYLLDGVDNNDQFLNRLVINPSIDAIQEFALLQNTYDAEYGRSAGAQLNMVLKSGTRTVHGSVYEFFRHSALDAPNALATPGDPEPQRQRHQFGGTLGGPLKMSRSFYFLNAEGINGSESDTRQAHVPTAAERAGDFSASGVAVRDPFTGQPFPGGVIPPSRISAAGGAAARLYPVPNRADAQANFVSSPLSDRTAGQFTVKTDHTVWRGSPLTLRYSFSRDNRDAPFPVRSRNLPGFGISVLDQGHNFGAGLTRAFTARMFNELRVGVNSLRRENLPQSAGADQFAALGISGPPITAADQGFPTLVVSGFETLGDDPNLPVVRKTRTIHIVDAMTFDRGRHHVKTGGEFRAVPIRRLQPLVRPRTVDVHRSVDRPSVRRSAARLPDAVAARRQRQPPGAAHLGGERIHPGRLASDAETGRQPRPALRVQCAAVRRRRPHAHPQPGNAPAPERRHGRRLAIGPRRRSQRHRPARRLQLGHDRQRRVARARRLRHLL